MAKLKTNEQFIKECIEIHGNKYDYSETFYTGAHNVITIICPIHGSFQQKAYSHVQGCGCLECAGVKKLTTKEFIEKSQKVHGNKFDYSEVDYQGNKLKVKIKCKKCGHIFEQQAQSHMKGFGCPFCSNNNKSTIEYNGSHWHKLKEERQPGCHAEKERRCKEANILLINVEERDWKNNRKSIENLLFTKIHTKNKVCNLRTFKN